jgi:hypothetical protein
MPDTNVVTLTGHPTIGIRRGGGCLILFSLPFIATGIAVAIGVQRDAVHGDKDLLYLFAGAFFLAGLATALGGVRASLHQARLKAAARRYPQEPWMRDYLWDRKGSREHPLAKAVKGLVGQVVFAVLLVPIQLWWVRDPSPVVKVILGIFDLALVLGIAFWIFDAARALKYGASWIEFDRFPFFVGEALDARLGCGRPLAGLQKVTITLRCVREEWVRMRSGNRRSSSLVCKQHWAETKEYGPQQLQMLSEVPVHFDLPAGDYSTSIVAGSTASYWEIEMKGEAPGIDLFARFLVPVYARA